MVPSFTLSFVFFFLVVLKGVVGLHFYLKPEEVECFYQDLNEGTILVGDIDGYVEKDGQFFDDPALFVGISVYEVFDNNERVLNQQNSHSGDFTLTALETGEHKICVKPMYPDSDANIRIFIGFDLVASEVADSKRKQDIKSLGERLSQSIERLQKIRNAQRTLREEEAKFRDQSESANGRILTWSILQIVAMAIVCTVQLRYLKKFFVKQKVL